MYFKEHPNLLRVSIPFFYFATTKTPVEIFLLQNDSCRYVPAHVFRPRAKKVSALSIHELRLATYTLIVILELVYGVMPKYTTDPFDQCYVTKLIFEYFAST